MKTLTKNIKLFFECDEDCPKNGEPIETDPVDLSESGPPVCPICNEVTAMSEWCLVSN